MKSTFESESLNSRQGWEDLERSPTRAPASSERPFSQRRSWESTAPTFVPESVTHTLAAPGHPLDPGTREFMEARLGHDFSRVRVHTDARAAESARAIKAHAYAAGSDIAFAPGKFATDTPEGRQLLAHELVHTVQQANLPAPCGNLTLDTAADSPWEREADHAAHVATEGPAAAGPTLGTPRLSPARAVHVARQKVAGYETKPIVFERADIEKLVGVSYWEQKVTGKYDLTFVNTVTDRFKADQEERDAVLSILWQRRPHAALKAEEVVTVSIPARTGSPKSQALLYQFTFQPVPKDAAKGTLEKVKVEFKAAGAQAAVSAAPTPPAGYVAPSLSRGANDFPGGIDDYLAKYPEEKKQLYLWIENVPGPAFDQIITTSTPLPAGKKHETNHRVTGTKPSGGKLTVEITYLSETPITVENPAAGYAAKDFADISLDEQHAKPTDKLGTITGLAAVPADEVLSVKYTIGQYFAGGTRNKEVDVVVPIAKKSTSVLYTLRFLPTTNDVEIQRVGEAGSSVALTATALNITRVAGFAENSADPAVFKAWITKRYPGVTPTGATLVELQASVNQAMAANAGTPAWFTANYGIEILDATAAEARLTTVHKQASALTTGLKSFTADDLHRLEFSLEAMGDSALKTVRGTRMVRQEVHLELVGKPPVVTPDAKTGGLTLQHGAEKTILIYDSPTANETHLFIGGTAGVRASSVGTYVHEFGHVLEMQNKLEAPFAAFVKAQGIAPLTWYAKSKPVTESFPEAFFVFQSDPEWMKSNLPALFTWLDAVNRTGAPPKP